MEKGQGGGALGGQGGGGVTKVYGADGGGVRGVGEGGARESGGGAARGCGGEFFVAPRMDPNSRSIGGEKSLCRKTIHLQILNKC